MNRLDKTHKRALRAVNNDFSMDMTEFLRQNGDVRIHTRHLQLLMTEVHKSLNQKNPQIMWELFSLKIT